MLIEYYRSWTRFIVFISLTSASLAGVNDEIESIAKQYAKNLIRNDEIIASNGLKLSLQDSEKGIWGDDAAYLPGGAIFVSIFDYNKDGYIDIGLSSSMNPYVSDLWLGGKEGYSKFASRIALGETLIEVQNNYAVKHRHSLNGSDSIDSYLWLGGKKPEFTTINSWEHWKVKGGNSNSIILQNIQDDIDGKLRVETIESEDWVSWVFDLLDENKATTWINPDYSEGRFGLGSFVDKTLSLYSPQDLNLANLRKSSLSYNKQESSSNGVKFPQSVNNVIEKSSLIKEGQKVEKTSSFPWIIAGVLLVGILALLFKTIKGKSTS